MTLTFPFRRLISFVLSVTLFASMPVPLFADSTPADANSQEDMAELQYKSDLAYWAELDYENPAITESALGQQDPLPWQINSDALLDSDPFFMASQKWVQGGPDCQNDSGDICATKQDGTLMLKVVGAGEGIALHQPLTPFLETQDYVFMTADDLSLFSAKVKGDSDPGEGIFFIAKRDIAAARAYSAPVPVFFFPMPGSGWRGDNAFELEETAQIVLYTQDKFGLALDLQDIATLENTERSNLILAQTFSALEGKAGPSGLPLPKPNSTLMFGTILSGQMPQVQFGDSTASLKRNSKTLTALNQIPNLLLPQASADPTDTTMGMPLTEIHNQVKAAADSCPMSAAKRSLWQRWRAPLTKYGIKAAIACAAYSVTPIDFSGLITADMPHAIANVLMKVGVVVLAAVAMKYSVHKSLFDKKYPASPDDTMLQTINKQHKGIMDEVAHLNYFSMAVTPQTIRHTLEYLKDRMFPNNKMIHSAWDATIGFSMRTSSRLAMNFKTYWYGMAYGMADATMVAVDLLIFAPFLVHFLGWGVMGATTAAYASSTILQQYLSYIQQAAHVYSSDVKMVYFKSAQDAAKRRLQAQKLDPDNPKNSGMLNALTEEEMERRYKVVGLPGKDEFLYDPITALESTIKSFGFSATQVQGLSVSEARELYSQDFVLKHRRWGMIKPALKRALATASEAQARSPSPVGESVVRLLTDALKNRSIPGNVAGRLYDVATSSGWAYDGLKQSIATEISAEIQKQKGTNKLTWAETLKARLRGSFKYLAQDSTKDARDMNLVLYLMSTKGSPKDMMKYLPQSWVDKAGSKDAAMIAAEMFNRGFFSYLESDETIINPTPQIEAAYGDRAQKLMARLSKTDPSLFADPFTREVRYREIMLRLKTRDDERAAILNYTPKDMGTVEAGQWGAVKMEAQTWAQALPTDDVVGDEWLSMAQKFAERTDTSMNGEEAISWARDMRYKFVVAKSIADRVNLTVKDPAQSDLVQKVILEASTRANKTLQLPNVVSYLSRLSSDYDRKFYEAQVFSRAFIESYVDLTVRDDKVSGSSPEYPGYLQGRRIKLAEQGKTISKFALGVEALFRNEDTSYAPGLAGMLDRNVPMIPSMVRNFIQNLRTIPYSISLTYLTNYFLWHIHAPYPVFVANLLLGFLWPALVEYNNRRMRNLDSKPMDGIPEKLDYSFWHSTLTNPEAMAFQNYAQSIQNAADGLVGDCESLLGKAQ